MFVPSKLKTNISSGANCPESFINRKEGDVSIIFVCRAAGWDRFYKLPHVVTLVRMTGWLADWLTGGKMEIATISNIYEDECKCTKEQTSIPWETDLCYIELYLTNDLRQFFSDWHRMSVCGTGPGRQAGEVGKNNGWSQDLSLRSSDRTRLEGEREVTWWWRQRRGRADLNSLSSDFLALLKHRTY